MFLLFACILIIVPFVDCCACTCGSKSIDELSVALSQCHLILQEQGCWFRIVGFCLLFAFTASVTRPGGADDKL